MSRNSIRALAILAAGPAVWGFAAEARAQTITLPSVLDRSGEIRDGRHQPKWVSRSDCIDQNDLVFNNVTYSGSFIGKTLEVWAGQSSCNSPTDVAARTGSSPTCWLVYREAVSRTGVSITIKARDVAGQHKWNSGGSWGPDSGTLDDCTPSTSSNPMPLGLYFMFMSGDQVLTGSTGATWSQTTLDIWGPAPPSSVTAGAGETRLHLGWSTTGIATDVKEYRFYCIPLSAAFDAAALGTANGPTGSLKQLLEGGVDGGDAAVTTGGSTGSGGSGGATSGMGGTGGAGGNATSTGGNTVAQTNCVSDIAVSSGQEADEAYRCGEVFGTYANEGVADGLTNNAQYAVSVAAVDEVGNVGPLSGNACGTPVNVTDFFELYRLMGGEGGGGFCSISPLGNSPEVPLVVVASTLGFVLVRRRRKR